MKALIGIATLVFVALVGWRIGGQLDAQAMGMAVGMLFGIMAGIPTALILLASERGNDDRPQRPRIEVQPVHPQQVTNNYYNTIVAAPDLVRKLQQLSGPMPEVPHRDRLTEIEERNR